jgi:hypothetical protein
MQTNTLIALVDGSAYAESVCHHAAWIAGTDRGKGEAVSRHGQASGPEHHDLSGAIRLGARPSCLQS